MSLTTTSTSEHSVALGRAIRARRALLGLSVSELARRSGLSQSFLSQVEMGQSDLSVGRLIRIAQVLDVDVADLLDSSPPLPGHLLLAADRTRLPNPTEGLRLYLLAPAPDKAQTYVHAVLEPGAVARATRDTPGSQYFVYLLEGSARIALANGESHTLGPEDSVSYRSEDFKEMQNLHDGETSFVWVQSARSSRGDRDR